MIRDTPSPLSQCLLGALLGWEASGELPRENHVERTPCSNPKPNLIQSYIDLGSLGTRLFPSCVSRLPSAWMFGLLPQDIQDVLRVLIFPISIIVACFSTELSARTAKWLRNSSVTFSMLERYSCTSMMHGRHLLIPGFLRRLSYPVYVEHNRWGSAFSWYLRAYTCSLHQIPIR